MELNRTGLDGALANGHPPPDLFVTPEKVETPYLEGGVTDLRELLLTREVADFESLKAQPDAPSGLKPEWFYFGFLDLAMLILIVHHGSLYLYLLEKYNEGGPSVEIDIAAIRAAVDIASVQQSAWRRLDMLATARHTQLDPGPPMSVLDELFFSFLLLTGRDPERALARLGADLLESRLSGRALGDWVRGAGYASTLAAGGVAELREARAEGADADELRALTLSTIEQARVTSAG